MTPLGAVHGHDIGRNRDESRTVTILDPANKLANIDWYPHVAAIIRVEREVFTRNSKTELLHRSAETAFYVSNAPITAHRAAEAIRAHWRIETTSHYSRDVTFGEDRSRIRTNPGVFARSRSAEAKAHLCRKPLDQVPINPSVRVQDRFARRLHYQDTEAAR